MMSVYTTKCTDVPQFDALQSAAYSFRTDEKLHLRNLCNDSARCAGLTASHVSQGGRRRILLDYSRQQVTGETLELLFDLADAVGFTQRRAAMQCGARINSTEGSAVLHHVLRMPQEYNIDQYIPGAGESLLQQVHEARDHIKDFTNNVRSGKYKGATGKILTNVLAIGVGGVQLGPEFVFEALRADPAASQAAMGRSLRFLANVDPVDFHLNTRDWDPQETMIIIICKTFSAAETILNARTVKEWLVAGFQEHETELTEAAIVTRHVIAISANVQQCVEFGIDESNIFPFWDWVSSRFCLCSAAGLIPLSLQYSYVVLSDMLRGAHDMDEHFFKAPLRDNVPILLGLLGIWNSTFLGYSTRALLPYAQALKRFPAFVQHLDMESNGKQVALDGSPLLHESGEINFGEVGTNGQNSFYQLLHQGRVVPAEFIGFMEPQHEIDLASEAVSNHDELMSNFFAQPDALAYGKTLTDLIQEGVPDGVREHMVFTGNRPSSSLLLTKLDSFCIGQLLALYEHRTAVQGFIWGINSFDQFGVELGKVLAKQVRAQLSASRKTGASVQGFNSSTSSLLEAYLVHGK